MKVVGKQTHLGNGGDGGVRGRGLAPAGLSGGLQRLVLRKARRRVGPQKLLHCLLRAAQLRVGAQEVEAHG